MKSKRIITKQEYKAVALKRLVFTIEKWFNGQKRYPKIKERNIETIVSTLDTYNSVQNALAESDRPLMVSVAFWMNSPLL